MDFRERILTTMNHEEPDRVPVMGLIMDTATVNKIKKKKPVDLANMLKNQKSKYSLMEHLNKNENWNEMYTDNFSEVLECSLELGFDANWMIYAFMRLADDPESKLGTVWHDHFGRVWEIESDEDGNNSVNYSRSLLDTPAKWDEWVGENADLFEQYVENLFKFNRYMTERYKDLIYPIGYAAPGIWENSWQPIGFVEFNKYIYRNPEFVKKVIDFHTNYYLKAIEAVCKTGVEVVMGGDDVGQKTGPLINPKTFDDLFGESYRRVTELVHKYDKKIIWHSCGRVYKFLDYFVDWGFDGIITMEPTAGMDLGKVRDYVGHKLALIGNLDVSYLLVRGTKEEIEDEVKSCIKKAARGGGYILSSCHSHPYVDPKRLKWMVDAAHKYGKY